MYDNAPASEMWTHQVFKQWSPIPSEEVTWLLKYQSSQQIKVCSSYLVAHEWIPSNFNFWTTESFHSSFAAYSKSNLKYFLTYLTF